MSRRGRMRAAVGAALIAIAAGCSSNAGPQTTPVSRWGETGPDSVSGTVRQVGNIPFVRTLVDGGADERVFVTGDLESEISRLAGMQVRVTGTGTEGDQPGPHILATSYEILELDGERPVVGILGSDDSGFYVALFGGAAYRLGAVPAELMEALGAKVWILAAEDRHVQGYGILKEAFE